MNDGLCVQTCLDADDRHARFKPNQTERKKPWRRWKAHAWLRVKDRTLVSLIIFLLTAAVNYSPRVVLQRWTWGLWDKGTGGGRWNYKILMMELWLNGNFLNWFWRGAQKEPAWWDTETGGGRGLLFHSLGFISRPSLDMFQPSSPLALLFFYPVLKLHPQVSVLLFPFLLPNLSCLFTHLFFSFPFFFLVAYTSKSMWIAFQVWSS